VKQLDAHGRAVLKNAASAAHGETALAAFMLGRNFPRAGSVASWAVTDQADIPVCPECGCGPAAANAAAKQPPRWVRAIPWLAVAALILFHVLRGVVQLQFGWLSFISAQPKQDFAYFVGTQHGYTRGDLERLAATASPGDQLLRDLLRDDRPNIYLEDADAMEVCLEPPKGRQLRIKLTGWPLRWRNENIDRTVDDVFHDQASLGDELRDAGEWERSYPHTWKVLIAGRTAGVTAQRLMLTRTPRLALAIAAATITLGLVAVGRRLLRPTTRRALTMLWVLAAVITAAASVLLVISAQGVQEDRLALLPDDAVARPFIASGLTVANLRAMLGSPEADARLAAALISVLPGTGPSGDVLMARRIIAAPFQTQFAEIGWPERILTYTRSWKPDPLGSGLNLPLKPEGTRLLAQTGSIAWVVPHGEGSRSSTWLIFEVGEIAIWIVRLAAVYGSVRVAIALVRRHRRRRRTAESRCLACGYDLSGAPIPAA
jgi:hypothetical protein